MKSIRKIIKRLMYGVALLLALAVLPFMTPVYWVLTGKSWLDKIFELTGKVGDL